VPTPILIAFDPLRADRGPLELGLAAHELTGVAVEAEVQVADPADALVRISGHVDVLVCGSRGYGPVRSVLLGGVSGRVVNAARCPVLVLPRGDEQPLAELTAP
jgi:nucleotide-binding universal stress UspA family protein